jgi:hypothetical protein
MVSPKMPGHSLASPHGAAAWTAHALAIEQFGPNDGDGRRGASQAGCHRVEPLDRLGSSEPRDKVMEQANGSLFIAAQATD